MSLKFRYATFLLLTFTLLLCVGLLSVYLLQKGFYLLTGAVFIVLYYITFQLGKKFAKIFLVLSTLRYLKKNNGLLSIEKYRNYIDAALGKRRSSAVKEEFKKQILFILVEENEIVLQDDTIVLLSSS